MNVLVVNAGSSSIKAAIFSGDPHALPHDAAWSAEIAWSRIPSRATLAWTSGAASGSSGVDVDAHGSAVAAVLETARTTFAATPDLVGHRIVHGLDESASSLLDARVRAVIERAAVLAPQHNDAALAGIDAAATTFPGVTQAVAFDTAFHTTLPPAAAAYPGPYAWYATDGIRRYGFHGISHRYCAERTATVLGRDPRTLRVVSAHLGNGCSLAAIDGGVSRDTTMGFTPLEGVMMGSRSGSIDPGLVLHLLRSGAYGVADLTRVLNEESGLTGLSQVSEDVRRVIAAADGGAAPAKLALDVYIHRLAGAIASMAAAIGGLDALAFTGGVGEHSAEVRRRTCERLTFLGITLDAERNAADGDRDIAAAGAGVRVAVVHAREEYAIARDVAPLAIPARR